MTRFFVFDWEYHAFSTDDYLCIYLFILLSWREFKKQTKIKSVAHCGAKSEKHTDLFIYLVSFHLFARQKNKLQLFMVI